MKKFLIIATFLCTCEPKYIAFGQTTKPQNKNERKAELHDAWKRLTQKKDSTATMITEIKKLVQTKIIYRTKIVERHDTIWRVDTCIAVFTPVDSATIAIIFKNREVPKVTKVGRIIRYIFHKKN